MCILYILFIDSVFFIYTDVCVSTGDRHDAESVI